MSSEATFFHHTYLKKKCTKHDEVQCKKKLITATYSAMHHTHLNHPFTFPSTRGMFPGKVCRPIILKERIGMVIPELFAESIVC